MKSWCVFKQLADSKLIVSSSMWIFLVPVIAKLLDLTGDFFLLPESVVIFPFTLYFLYFSAIAFFLGYLVYVVFCPSFVKKLDGYNDFLDSGFKIHKINESISNVESNKAELLKRNIKCKIDPASSDAIEKVFTLTIGREPLNFTFEKESMDVVFWLVYDHHLGSNWFAQAVCWFFFGLGYLMLSIIFFTNFYYVVKNILL